MKTAVRTGSIVLASVLAVALASPFGDVVPSLKKAYTANKDSGHISVVDLAKKTVTQIPTPTGTEGIIWDGKYIFAGNQTRSELLVIDPSTDEILKKIALRSASLHLGALSRPKEALHHFLEPSARQDDMGGRFPSTTRRPAFNAWAKAQGWTLSSELLDRA